MSDGTMHERRIEDLLQRIDTRDATISRLEGELREARKSVEAASKFCEHAKETAEVMNDCNANWVGGCETCLELFDLMVRALATPAQQNKEPQTHEPPAERVERLVKALKLYMFCEQTDGGRNPHKEGTNKHAAFEAGKVALRAEEKADE